MQTATQATSPQVHSGQPSGPDHRILPPGVRWETYESLLADMQDNHAAQFAYDRGLLEIMAPSYEHDNLKHIFAVLVEFLAGEMEIDIEGGGSTTFRRQDLARGFEPDECFYTTRRAVRGKKQIDLAQDPPPATPRFTQSNSPELLRSLTMSVVQRRFRPGGDTYADILDPGA